ncbi:MAG: SufE family protein [Planctomycetales bacterium]
MKLDQLLAEFDENDPEIALETLMEFSETLPPTARVQGGVSPDPGCRIQECQTPVYLWVEVRDGGVHLEASVTEKSPTVRGFVALLVEGLAGATPAEVLQLPDDFLPRLGLSETLGMTRRRGFLGIVSRIKREVSRLTGTNLPNGTGSIS